ncbi:hypothetical protein AX17_000769 [Amanita inopinata Kibby_2008]|nr:hypothetical protein AX17_000769 [Amanita inopinata Kibby_2008]
MDSGIAELNTFAHSSRSDLFDHHGWEVRLSSTRGVPYFYNTETRQSTWASPAELTQDQIIQLPGAKEFLSGRPEKAAKVDQARASHLLVKHRGSRRPSSWKEANITRSKEDAIGILREYQARINGSAEIFAQLAQQHSDCSSHTNGGDLGWFGRGQMQKPFEEAVYGLEVGQMSDVVSTDSGVHLILRTA